MWISDVDIALPIHREVRLIGDRLTIPADDRPGRDRLEVGTKLFNTLVPSVRHVEISGLVYTDADWLVKETEPRASTPEAAQELAIRVKFLNPLIPSIRNVEVPPTIEGDRPGSEELAGATFWLADRLAPPGANELTGRIEFLDPVIPGVGNVDLTTLINRDSPRLVELPITGSFRTPSADE